MIHSYHRIQSLCSLQLGLPFPTRLGSMPSSDGVRRTRGAVFSMDQLIIAGAFRLWSTARGVTSIHAGSHQTTQPARAGNIAAGVKPADPRTRQTIQPVQIDEPRSKILRTSQCSFHAPIIEGQADKIRRDGRRRAGQQRQEPRSRVPTDKGGDCTTKSASHGEPAK